MTAERRLKHAYNIEDLRRMARARLPQGLFDFVDRGAEDEVSLRANRAAFERIEFEPRIGVDVSTLDITTTVFGQPVQAPLAIGPTGMTSMLWYDGEYQQAQAAAAHGVPFTLSMVSLTSVERIGSIPGLILWAQIYMMKDKGLTDAYLARADAAGARVLLLTMDLSVPPNREYLGRSGFTPPYKLTARNAVDYLQHPAWLLGCVGRYARNGGIPGFANMPEGRGGPINRIETYKDMAVSSALSWADVERLRRAWPHKLVLKGLSAPQDAVIAADMGVDGVVVSNHGGRGLDGSAPSIERLPAVAEAAGHRLTVMMDGGVRRGSDVVKAVGLGAQMVLSGRPTLYGAAAGGGAGVSRTLDILKSETQRVLGLLGCRRWSDLQPEHLRLPPSMVRSA